MKILAFFNLKGGVGKTTLIYNLTWMLAEQGWRTLAADLDPQVSLTRWFLTVDRLGEIWSNEGHPQSIFGAVKPAHEGTGGTAPPHVEEISSRIGLIPGDLRLSELEDSRASDWLNSFSPALRQAAADFEADIVLVDTGPSLGAINRAAVIAADHVVVPLAPDLFSLSGLASLGQTLRTWPVGPPAGYILLQSPIHLDQGTRTVGQWLEELPAAYRQHVLNEPDAAPIRVEADPNCLGRLRNYPSLITLAQKAQKPLFLLRPADGALGGLQAAVQQSYADFRALARRIAAFCDLNDALRSQRLGNSG